MSTRFYNPRASYTDLSGEPLAGGKLYFYISGTSTPSDTYVDKDLANPHANPIILDSAGRLPNDVFLDPAITYKVILTNAAGVAIWTADPVNDPNAAAITTLETRVTAAEGDITANATAVDSLDTRVTQNADGITANSLSITSLEADVSDLVAGVDGNSTAITTLQARVTTTEGDITANATSITSLESSVTDLQTDVTGNATAISGLETDVTALDGEVTSLSESFTTVFASNGVGDTSAMFRMVAAAGPTGYDATIRLEAKVEGDSFTSSNATIEMDVGAGIPSRIRFIADRLVMATAAGAGATIVPFATFTGSKITFSTDVEIDGDLLVSGSVVTDGIAEDAITESTMDSGSAINTQLDSWITIATLSLTAVAGEKVLFFHEYLATSDESGIGWRYGIEHRVTLNGVVIDGPVTVIEDGNGLGSTEVARTVWHRNEPSAGSATYRVQARRFGTGGFGAYYEASVLALGNKR